MFGIDDALIFAGANLLGGMASGRAANSQRADTAQQANEFSASQFATRYQTTVKDMQAAGLNPMLAYSQGGGSPPSGQQASVQDVGGPAFDSGVRAFSAARAAEVQKAQADNIEADAQVKRAQISLIESQVNANNASADQARGNVGLMETQGFKIKEEIKNLAVNRDLVASQISQSLSSTALNQAQVNKITAEVKNLPLEGARLVAVAANLYASNQLMVKQGKTQEQIAAHTEQMARKAFFDADLSALDVSAATSFNNLGREVQQLKPIFDIIRGILRR